MIGSSHSFFNNIKTKINAGAGIEYLPMPKFGLRLYGEYDFGMNDDWDNLVSGKRNDNLFRIGLSLNYYFGKPKN